jgi:tRNA(Ile)-lysidine synthase
VSLTVDHRLQPSSSAMADQCAKFAASLNVEHLTTSIPWSDAPFPLKPSTGESFEGVARLARQHVLFRAMTLVGTRVLALGHHGDDQAETSLMRLERKTTELGAAGMRSCRRWGMGHAKDEESLGWAGYEGMRRWVVRPLLEFGKVSHRGWVLARGP